MRWLVYMTEAEALAADAAISAAMGLPTPGINAATGELDWTALTVRWAVPRQINDGRWVIPSPDEQGVEGEPGWWPEEVTP
jgi:uncharacterized membrane-anchored protein